MKPAVLSLLLVIPFLLGADEFSVKKFVAKGDGKTDDTEAIQAAANAAHKRTRVFRKMGNQPASSAFGTGQTVTFPPGVYKVTKTIRFSGYVSAAGTDGSAMIQWHGEDHGTIFDIRSFRNRVEKLIFAGGGTHLRVGNKNIDKTMVTIRDCQFFYADKIAVLLEPAQGANHLSEQTLIEACLFSKNARCVQNYGDLMEIRNCWVDQTQPQMADGAAFINRYGTMRIAFCCLTPSANPDKGPLYYHNARWVDNYGRFEAESVRFGGEGGGIPAVYNYGKVASKHPWSGGSRISIRNCLIACGQMARENGSVIRLFALPSQIVVENNYEMTVVPFILCDPALDVEAEIKKNPKGSAMIRYHIFNNRMANPAVNAVPAELKRFFTKESDCRFAEIKARPVPAEITGPAAQKKKP
ncbi:MAG: hypothetical protein IJH79_17370 [Lentisphaeria bacterium]|nr:hypothetical protein [Lentisphaeria bacterium]